jgi:NAD(P)-dependent dehydrogenase (short-subunit alcohol dehydrogenase family)
MAKQLFIVTGSSRGMGHAIAAQLLAPDAVVLGIARHSSDDLQDRAASLSARLEQWPLDLAEGSAVSERLQAWLVGFGPAEFATATLINNAAVINRVGPVDACSLADLAGALRVSLEAPMLLTAAFLRATRGWSGARRVLNISSGLGRRAMAGSASYCAAKAGLDHFSRAVALDEAQRENGAKIVSLAPGVIDTDMQVQLRGAAPEGFPDQADFIRLKERGQLASPAAAAARVIACLDRPDFGANPVADVRDLA